MHFHPMSFQYPGRFSLILENPWSEVFDIRNNCRKLFSKRAELLEFWWSAEKDLKAEDKERIRELPEKESYWGINWKKWIWGGGSYNGGNTWIGRSLQWAETRELEGVYNGWKHVNWKESTMGGNTWIGRRLQWEETRELEGDYNGWKHVNWKEITMGGNTGNGRSLQ